MSSNPNTKAREFALQFLYQMESEKVFLFSDGIFRNFIEHRNIPVQFVMRIRELVKGTLDQLIDLDEQIEAASQRWRLSRMPMVDRNILRLGTFELLESKTPPKVVLNEAINVASKFGGKDSGKFINGILDRIATEKISTEKISTEKLSMEKLGPGRASSPSR